MKEHFVIKYDKREKIRIDKFLSGIEIEKLLSRSFIDKLISNGNIRVNSKECKKNYKLSFGDLIEIDLPQEPKTDIEPLQMNLDIVYEDEYFIIVNKPAGLTVHPAPGHYNDTLVNALVYNFKDKLSSGYNDMRPGIVHRLDKDTSGLIIVAKNDKIHLLLSKMFQERKIEKKYLAITINHPPKDKGTIKTFLNRDKRDRKRFAVSKEGKSAITHYKLIERFEYFSLIELVLETGRTHQIRIHLKYINCPILGDEVYSGVKTILSYLPQNFHKKMKLLLKNHLKRQALHSYKLNFVHPITGENISVKSELPKDMKFVLEWIKKVEDEN